MGTEVGMMMITNLFEIKGIHFIDMLSIPTFVIFVALVSRSKHICTNLYKNVIKLI